MRVPDLHIPADVGAEASHLGRPAMPSFALARAIALMPDAQPLAAATYDGHIGPITGERVSDAHRAPGLARDALVCDRVGGSAWKGLPKSINDWLKKHQA